MFGVPIKESIESMIQKDIELVEESFTVGDVFEYLIIENKLVIIQDCEHEKIVGYLSIYDIPHIMKRYESNYREIPLRTVMNTDFELINERCGFLSYDKLIENGSYMNIIVNVEGKLKGYISSRYIKYTNYEELEEKYTTLKYITGQINEGISAIDKDGIVIFWNRFMEERYDIPASEIVGKKMSDYLEDTISGRALVTKKDMNDFYHSKNIEEGTDLYGFVQASPVFYNEEFVGVVCTEVDITDATKLSKELELTQERLNYLESEVKSLSRNDFDEILGNSYALERSKQIAKQVAKSNSSIMLNGESGTGKEVFARAIHKYSEREGTFIPVNCSAIPQELFESEFFGYAPGAFTGATKAGKSGIFELANNGTIFLDEIGDMPLNMQVKLLRVLQEKEFMRVGGSDIIKVNVRVIAASNKDIKQMVRDGKFREDLFYRLNVVEIKLPPLRERTGDVRILVYHFLEEQCKENNKPFLKISKEALKLLEKYYWKGNIRELKNTIENMVVLSSGDTLEVEDVPEYIIEAISKPKNFDYPMDLNRAIEILEINKIKEALKMARGNKSKASKILNIPRTTLYYKMNQYNIE
ncbi:sigma 54-interacting transcriptional regulator [Peptostreptococcus russellii]|uniref:PAS domain S-box-containing protein n=1 Tax=Peptostreptococcus russellii TaxID=215200 RepID=A0A1H8FKN4_9FIRM|nr:sigma 54-interacting transcriptional regulator [Peptostreptococcus russellii]SEN32313.1 PAS domain S-box-containing protein [Peptostreptococcus russellii]